MREETEETVADIVDDMLTTARVCGDGAVRYDMFHYARRIEAAWKREKAEIEVSALSAGGIVEAQRHKGNAAAMREALEIAHDKEKGEVLYVR